MSQKDITRRDFLLKAAVITAGVGGVTHLLFGENEKVVSSKETIRLSHQHSKRIVELEKAVAERQETLTRIQEGLDRRQEGVEIFKNRIKDEDNVGLKKQLAEHIAKLEKDVARLQEAREKRQEQLECIKTSYKNLADRVSS